MHIMVDLETMGSRPGSAIASIGAVAFDPVLGTLGDTFYEVVDLASCERAGLTIDASTVMWWLGQGDDARKALGVASRLHLADALEAFAGWLGVQTGGELGWLRIWGHGGNFDEPMLTAAYRAVGLHVPWRYSGGRCTRTIFELAGVTPDRAAGTHHNARDDAYAQALAVIEAYRRLGLAARPTGVSEELDAVSGRLA